MVVFATPGMLHAGQSLEIFKKWCTDEKNCIIMPGYCVAGTVGHRILHGEKRIQESVIKIWILTFERLIFRAWTMQNKKEPWIFLKI